MSSRYPGGNFERNQLLDGSIGLSPLCPDQKIDLHVRISFRPPSKFPLTSSLSGHSSPSFGSLRVYSRRFYSSSLIKTKETVTFIPCYVFPPTSHSHTPKTPWSVLQDGSRTHHPSLWKGWRVFASPVSNFKSFFHSLSRVLFIFPSRYFFSIGFLPLYLK